MKSITENQGTVLKGLTHLGSETVRTAESQTLGHRLDQRACGCTVSEGPAEAQRSLNTGHMRTRSHSCSGFLGEAGGLSMGNTGALGARPCRVSWGLERAVGLLGEPGWLRSTPGGLGPRHPRPADGQHEGLQAALPYPGTGTSLRSPNPLEDTVHSSLLPASLGVAHLSVGL